MTILCNRYSKASVVSRRFVGKNTQIGRIIHSVPIGESLIANEITTVVDCQPQRVKFSLNRPRKQ